MSQPNHKMSSRRVPPRSNFDEKVKGIGRDDIGLETALQSSYRPYNGVTGHPVVTPIYHATTYEMHEAGDLMKAAVDGGAIYARMGNPTLESLEATINLIEKGAGTLSFASGMAGISTVLLGFLEKGDHVIVQEPGYSGTLDMLTHMSTHLGLEVTKVTHAKYEDLCKAIRPNTKMIWIESPCNPDVIVVDVECIAKRAQQDNILVALDGSFASPYAQQGIALGVDFSVHSCSKYMGGHSDLLGGAVTTRTVDQWRRLKYMQLILGNMMSAREASILQRSLKTLPIRMEKISSNAMAVAKFLEGHSGISRVWYPGLPSHPQHKTAVKQMKVFSGMIMFEMEDGGMAGRAVAENVKLIKMGVSLGGVESLIEHPMGMTHGGCLKKAHDCGDITLTPGMMRLSIGIEDSKDLIQDLDQAINKALKELPAE